ncbi:hypothetical protein [Stutzerimonas stutzeri]|nr:hypothetical protein [Stutzerimonas stutzeri]
MTHRYAQGAAETEVEYWLQDKSGRYLLSNRAMNPTFKPAA